MKHLESHPLAYKKARIKPDVKHLQYPNFGGSVIAIEDWWDKVSGKSWMFSDGNPAALVYAMRSALAGLPTDDEVLYGKVDGLGSIVHVSEIQELE